MTTVEVDKAEPADLEPARRPRLWWALGGLCTAAVLVGAGGWLMLVHQPLGVGSGGYGLWSDDTATASLSVPGQTRDTWLVAYQEGAAVEVAFPLWNDGPLPVRLTGIGPLQEGSTCGFQLRDVALQHDGGMDRAAATPFEPVSLAPGGYVQVWLSGRYGEPCFESFPAAQGGGWSHQDRVPVRFAVLGIPRSAEVDLGPVLVTSYVVDDPWLQAGDW